MRPNLSPLCTPILNLVLFQTVVHTHVMYPRSIAIDHSDFRLLYCSSRLTWNHISISYHRVTIKFVLQHSRIPKSCFNVMPVDPRSNLMSFGTPQVDGQPHDKQYFKTLVFLQFQNVTIFSWPMNQMCPTLLLLFPNSFYEHTCCSCLVLAIV